MKRIAIGIAVVCGIFGLVALVQFKTDTDTPQRAAVDARAIELASLLSEPHLRGIASNPASAAEFDILLRDTCSSLAERRSPAECLALELAGVKKLWARVRFDGAAAYLIAMGAGNAN